MAHGKFSISEQAKKKALRKTSTHGPRKRGNSIAKKAKVKKVSKKESAKKANKAVKETKPKTVLEKLVASQNAKSESDEVKKGNATLKSGTINRPTRYDFAAARKRSERKKDK